MTIAKPFILIAMIACMLAASACSSLFSSENSLLQKHPEALPTGRPLCTDCHEDQPMKGALKPYATFNHTEDFVSNHRQFAGRDERACLFCHASSFCNDCHANELEVKPPIKLGDRPDRELVHRGDFLTRHRIEGKIDPTSCYRCHGRTNNEQCMACHR